MGQKTYQNHVFEFVKLPDGTFGLDDIYARVPAFLSFDPLALARWSGSRTKW